ncbi:hypothetical protein BANRA_04002 [Acinetobacter baumannii]|nr:hypothetical protein BANRA_04002 [Acinetobacter baumannii]
MFQPNFSSAPNIEALSLEEIEHSWQTTGLSAVSVSQAVIKPMLKQQRGTIFSWRHLITPLYDVLSQSMFAVFERYRSHWQESFKRNTRDILHGGKMGWQTSTLFHLLNKSVSISISSQILHGAKSLACLEILLSVLKKMLWNDNRTIILNT